MLEVPAGGWGINKQSLRIRIQLSRPVSNIRKTMNAFPAWDEEEVSSACKQQVTLALLRDYLADVPESFKKLERDEQLHELDMYRTRLRSVPIVVPRSMIPVSKCARKLLR